MNNFLLENLILKRYYWGVNEICLSVSSESASVVIPRRITVCYPLYFEEREEIGENNRVLSLLSFFPMVNRVLLQQISIRYLHLYRIHKAYDVKVG